MAKAKAKLSFTSEALKKSLKIDPLVIDELAEFIVDQIRQLAQGSRKGIKGLQANPLPLLSPGYISQRQGTVQFQAVNKRTGEIKDVKFQLREKPDLSPNTNPGIKRSNLTYSGNLLDSLTARTNKSTGTITIFFKGNHPIAKVSNNQLYKWLLQKNSDYKILGVNKTIRRRLNEKITIAVTRKLRNLRR